jgi:hypothetical protein
VAWHWLTWGVVGSLALLWSLFCWAAHAVLGWEGWASGADWVKDMPALPIPTWLQELLGIAWVDNLREWLGEWGPEIHAWFVGVLGSLPDLGGWLQVAVWIVWAMGFGLLVLGGLLVSGLVAVARRATAKPA